MLVAAAMMMLMMFAASVPAFGQGLGPGACDLQPGQTEKARSPFLAPPGDEPGAGIRSPTGGTRPERP